MSTDIEITKENIMELINDFFNMIEENELSNCLSNDDKKSIKSCVRDNINRVFPLSPKKYHPVLNPTKRKTKQDPEKLKEYFKRYIEKNREKYNKMQASYYHKRKEEKMKEEKEEKKNKMNLKNK